MEWKSFEFNFGSGWIFHMGSIFVFEHLFIGFLFRPDEISQNTHLVVVVLVEVKMVLVSEPDLKQVIVETLFWNVDFLGCFLKG